jgi:hypothetical protein
VMPGWGRRLFQHRCPRTRKRIDAFTRSRCAQNNSHWKPRNSATRPASRGDQRAALVKDDRSRKRALAAAFPFAGSRPRAWH